MIRIEISIFYSSNSVNSDSDKLPKGNTVQPTLGRLPRYIGAAAFKPQEAYVLWPVICFHFSLNFVIFVSLFTKSFANLIRFLITKFTSFIQINTPTIFVTYIYSCNSSLQISLSTFGIDFYHFTVVSNSSFIVF